MRRLLNCFSLDCELKNPYIKVCYKYGGTIFNSYSTICTRGGFSLFEHLSPAPEGNMYIYAINNKFYR